MADDDLMRFTLRMPKALYDRLSIAGDEAVRSTNAEIVARLEQSFQERGSGTSFAPPEIAKNISEAVAAGIDTIIDRFDLQVSADQTTIYMFANFYIGFYSYILSQGINEKDIGIYWREAFKLAQQWKSSIEPSLSKHLEKTRTFRSEAAKRVAKQEKPKSITENQD